MAYDARRTEAHALKTWMVLMLENMEEGKEMRNYGKAKKGQKRLSIPKTWTHPQKLHKTAQKVFRFDWISCYKHIRK